jgi:hypothetical protein
LDPCHQQQPSAGQDGPGGQRFPRADALAIAPEGAEGISISTVSGSVAARGLKCGVAEAGLQERNEQEDQAAERSIGHQRERSARCELTTCVSC